MITQMQNLTDAEHAILNQTWRGKKILSYLQAYGFDYEFCRSFRLTEGEKTGWMLLFNATLLICAEQPVALEETKTFVEMHLPFRIECPASFLPTLATLPNYQKLRRTMFVLTPQPVSEEFQPEAVQKQPDLTAVYQILHEGFPNLLSYPLWLTDTSHRCRHGISGYARDFLHWLANQLQQQGKYAVLYALDIRVSFYQEIGFEAADTEWVLERSDIEKEDVTKGALQ